MQYSLYMTTNKINERFYIGAHQAENIYDEYFGSGLMLLQAIKKYGKENFEKIVFETFDSEKEMYEAERIIVNEDFIKRSDTYNLTIGGNGGPAFKGHKHSNETKKKISKVSKQLKHSDKTKRKISESLKGRPVSAETRKKLSKALKGRIHSEHTRLKHSDETKKKISESLKGKNHSEESKLKMSKSHKGKKLSEETKSKISKTMTSHKVSEKTRQKLRDKNKGKIPWNKGLKFTN